MPSACIVDAYVDGNSVQALNNKEKLKASDTFLSTAATILRILGLNSKATSTRSNNNNNNKQKKRQKSSAAKLSIIEPQKMPTLSNYSDSKQKGILQMSPINEKVIETNISSSNDETTTTTSSSPPSTTTTTKNQDQSIPISPEHNPQITSPPPVHPASMGATSRAQKRSANDFRFGKSIGEGSFSTVYLAEDIHTRKEYAIKVCDKQHIIREKKQEYIKREREILNMLSNCPSFVNLYCTFQDARNLYFVMTYAKNGDLLPYINKVGCFDLECSKFYAAELVIALETLHSKGVIHRDLKPENILLDDKMHVLLADFGSAKIMSTRHDVSDGLSNADLQESERVQKQEQIDVEAENNQGRRRKNSFVGTAQYVSPEVLKGQATSRFTDLWALGCIIYQMISGLPPFRAATEHLIFQKVLKLEMSFPEDFDTNARDLVQALVQIDPSERLGSRDMGDTYESIRKHPFFESIDWDAIRRGSPPPIQPGFGEEESMLHYRVPDNISPGLGDEQLRRLIGMELGTQTFDIQIKSEVIPNETTTIKKSTIIQSKDDKEKQLIEQAKNNRWHSFADGEVILKQGFVNKRKGLFARKRMLLLTTGPRLIYIDPVQMVKKGEIPWSAELKTEPKNFKIFFVHTPNRTYYLDDPEGYALSWCKAIDEVKTDTYKVK